MLIINTQREGYSTDQCPKTMTVAELKSELNSFDDEDKVYLSFDGGYTYGSIKPSRLEWEDDGEWKEEDDS